ncbi:hypothetical protein NOF04DRAFT_1349468 [Fusarium oxysporum II5]|nr:hypothetical protein NOF04DRAFT_1349468 [Fusarium oxysporum II5]
MSTETSLSAPRNDTLMIWLPAELTDDSRWRNGGIGLSHRKHYLSVDSSLKLKCLSDYPTVIENGPFTDDVVDEDSIEGRGLDSIRHMEVSRGSGLVLPTVFVPPPSATPQSLSPAGIGRNGHPPVTRFIRVDDPKSFLICTDGACLGNGQVEPKAGWTSVFGPLEQNTNASVNERLEHQSPLGDFAHPTSNRAELRATIGALRYRNWASEGFTTLVLATDSEYVVKGLSWGGRALG